MTYIVHFGACSFKYRTDWHAEQMMHALRLNGTPCVLQLLPKP